MQENIRKMNLKTDLLDALLARLVEEEMEARSVLKDHGVRD